MVRKIYLIAFTLLCSHGFLFAQQHGIILIKSTPSGAIVFIDRQPTNKKTPYQALKPAGQYNFRLEAVNYRTYQGSFTIKANETTTLNIKLSPVFGSLNINSNPPGASIEINNKETGRKTPATLDRIPSGKYFITLTKENYAPQVKDVEIRDGRQTDVVFDLEGQFGTIGIVTKPEAEILIDELKISEGTYSGTLSPGKHVVEVRKDNYHTQRKEIHVESGGENRLIFELEPILGSLAIMTEPPELEIYIDNESKGKSPLIIPQIITGEHKVEIKGSSNLKYEKTIMVEPGEMQPLNIDFNNMPIVKLGQPIDITATSARIVSEIKGSFEEPVTSKGVVWGTSLNPVISGSKTENGSGTGTFTSQINSLAPHTKYYVRVYAVNEHGIHYGNQLAFTTKSVLKDMDGNIYKTIAIGKQVWMAENLKTTSLNDSTPIIKVEKENAWNRLKTLGYCWYKNKISYKNNYGVLYNWYVVETDKLCPNGWHVPTDADWTELESYLGGRSIAGNKLKETGTTHWDRPNIGATNESGFTALPGGRRGGNGVFSDLGYTTYFWSSTRYSNSNAWLRNLGFSDSGMGKYDGSKKFGLSVRCIKD